MILGPNQCKDFLYQRNHRRHLLKQYVQWEFIHMEKVKVELAMEYNFCYTLNCTVCNLRDSIRPTFISFLTRQAIWFSLDDCYCNEVLTERGLRPRLIFHRGA